MLRYRRFAGLLLALLVVGCGGPTTAVVSPSVEIAVTPEPSTGPPTAWLEAVCQARDAAQTPTTDGLIRAASALDAAPAWPQGDVAREPLRDAIDHLILQERDGSIDAAFAALEALAEHSEAATALFGSAEGMCA